MLQDQPNATPVVVMCAENRSLNVGHGVFQGLTQMVLWVRP